MKRNGKRLSCLNVLAAAPRRSPGWMTGPMPRPPTVQVLARRPPPPQPLLALRVRRSRADLPRNLSERGTCSNAQQCTMSFPQFPVTVPSKAFQTFFLRPTNNLANVSEYHVFHTWSNQKNHPLFSFLPLNQVFVAHSSGCRFFLRSPYSFFPPENGHFSPLIRALLVDTMARSSFHVTSC